MGRELGSGLQRSTNELCVSFLPPSLSFLRRFKVSSPRTSPTASRPPLASLDWSAASQSSMPGSFSQLSPTKLVSPSSTAGDEEAHSLYTKETHAAMERWLVQRMKEREDEFLEKGEIRYVDLFLAVFSEC